jgi:hypothetical protein
MASDGVFVQWIPANLPPKAFRMALKTFVATFPHSAAFYFPPSCLVLAGSASPLAAYDDIAEPPHPLPVWARAELSPYHVGTRELLLAGRVCSGSSLLPKLTEDHVNTWDEPVLEFIPYKDWKAEKNRLYYYENTGLLIATGLAESRAGMIHPPDDLRPAFESSTVMRIGFLELMRTMAPDSLRPYCERALVLNPADSMAAAALQDIPHGLKSVMIPGS